MTPISKVFSFWKNRQLILTPPIVWMISPRLLSIFTLHTFLPATVDNLTSQLASLFRFQEDSIEESLNEIHPSPTNFLAAKISAYADDTFVFLSNHDDFHRLQHAVIIYSAASNAHLNYQKTEATSLSG